MLNSCFNGVVVFLFVCCNGVLLLLFVYIFEYNYNISLTDTSDYCFIMNDTYEHLNLLRGGKTCQYHLENN